MTQVHSRSGSEAAGDPALPAGASSESPPPATEATSAPTELLVVSDSGGDHTVVLWDEVKPPEASDNKPLDKDLPDDPSAH